MSCICNFCCCFRGCWDKLSQRIFKNKKYKTVTSDPRDQLVSNNSDENVKIVGRKSTLAEEDKSMDSEVIAMDHLEHYSNTHEKNSHTSQEISIGMNYQRRSKFHEKVSSLPPNNIQRNSSKSLNKEIDNDNIQTDRMLIEEISKNHEVKIESNSDSQSVENINNEDFEKAPECAEDIQEVIHQDDSKSQDYTDNNMELFNKNEKVTKVRESASSDLIDFPIQQDSNKESFAHESVDSNDKTVKYFESPLKVEDQFDEIEEEQLQKIVDYDEVEEKIKLLNNLISRMSILEDELCVFEEQLEHNQPTQKFIGSIMNKIHEVIQKSDDVLNELLQIEEIAQDSPKPYSKEEIDEANDRIDYVYQRVEEINNSVIECELEFKAFERSVSKDIVEYINSELDNFLPKYEELNERTTSLQEDIYRFYKMFNLMKSKNDYKENAEFIDDAISNLQLEEQRIKIFQQDSDKISDIVKKGVQWQVNRFQNINFNELQEMRRYFGNLEPSIFNKNMIEEEFNSILDINDRILNVYNDLGDANIQNNFSSKAAIIEELNEILNLCESNARSLDEIVSIIKTNPEVDTDDLLKVQEIEGKLDNYFEQISDLNKRCEEDNQKIESLKEKLEDLPNIDIIGVHTSNPSESLSDNQNESPTLIDEIENLGKNTSNDIEISSRINSELESHLVIVEEIESKYNK